MPNDKDQDRSTANSQLETTPTDVTNQTNPANMPAANLAPSGSDAATAMNDSTAQFEQALSGHEQRHYYFRLYIAGTTPHSMRSLENLKALCETYLPGQYELEVIDIYQSASTLQIDNVVAIPTLVKQLPLPIRRVIGDLSNTEKVLLGLDLIAK